MHNINNVAIKQPLHTCEEDSALIKLENVSKFYKTEAGEFIALKEVDLCIGRGEFISVMGKSGSGKSTLINMITGIDHPTAGKVFVGGENIHQMSEGELAVWRGRSMGVVFQFFQLLPMLSVLENTILPMDFCGMFSPEEREDRAMGLLKLLGLEQEADELPIALSGGQQQIAAIARSLANDPPIIVADEPTGNLDSGTADKVMGIFSNLVSEGKTIVFVTHDRDLSKWSERQILLSDGEIINEHIAGAFPNLGHQQMLQISRSVKACSFRPGATIAKNGGAEAGMYILTNGQVEVLKNGRSNPAEVVGLLNPGDHFGNFDMANDESCHLSFRAASKDFVEVLWLDGSEFEKLISEQSIRDSLQTIAAERTARLCNPLNREKIHDKTALV